MTYTVLARKYRPQTFSDLVGQEHVTRTLSNAIRASRVAHAFLFTGVRGVGKTSAARILAKALNCEGGPTPEPCGVCDPCRDITSGRDTDVLEMDGASNNSVEDVRRLQESIPYRPSRDRFKIVIVDEVHMLSTGAFNAFLKTLEEPPPHVKFIFATTEIHKVPVTIRSRCQRYDFRLIPQNLVSGRVREILAAEGIEADDGAVAIVAREAAGSMRDALTLLDQIVAFGGERLVGEEVARVLGIADRDVLHRVTKAFLTGDGADALRAVDEIASRGLDMLHFARQLLDLVRDMVVLRVCGAETDLCGLVQEERALAREVAGAVDMQELQRAFSALSKLVEDVAQSGTPRTTLEMGLVRLATRPPLRPLAELVARLEELERRAAGGGSGGAGGGTRRAPRSEGGGRPAPSGARASQASSASAAASALPRPLPQAAAVGDDPGTSPSTSASVGMSVGADTSMSVGASAGTSTSTSTSVGTGTSVGTSAGTGTGTGTGASTSTSTSVGAGTSVGTSVGTSADVGVDAGAQANGRAHWQRIVAMVMEAKPSAGAVLQHAAPLEVSAARIMLGYPTGSFFGRQAEALAKQQVLADAAERVLGARPTIEVVHVGGAGSTTKTLAEEETERRDALLSATQKRAMDHPLVAEVSQLFAIPRERMTVRVEQDHDGTA